MSAYRTCGKMAAAGTSTWNPGSRTHAVDTASTSRPVDGAQDGPAASGSSRDGRRLGGKG